MQKEMWLWKIRWGRGKQKHGGGKKGGRRNKDGKGGKGRRETGNGAMKRERKEWRTKGRGKQWGTQAWMYLFGAPVFPFGVAALVEVSWETAIGKSERAAEP